MNRPSPNNSMEHTFELIRGPDCYLGFTVPTDVGLSIILSEHPRNEGASVTNMVESLIPLADYLADRIGAHPQRRYFETYLFASNKPEDCRLDEIVCAQPPAWRPVPALAASELLEHCVRLAADAVGFEPSAKVLKRLAELSDVDDNSPIPPLR